MTDCFVRPVIPVFPAERDTKFTAQFEELRTQDGIKLKRTAVRAAAHDVPHLWLVDGWRVYESLGAVRLSALITSLCSARTHQNKGNLPLGIKKPPDSGSELGQLVIHERLGGLLKHYERKAA